MSPGIYGILIRLLSDFFLKNQDSYLEDLRILPLDVFYISQLSEKYKGSSFPFLKGMSKAIVFAIIIGFQKKEEQFGYLHPSKIFRLIPVKPAISSGIISKLKGNCYFVCPIGNTLNFLKSVIICISKKHILIFYTNVCY